MAVQTVHGDRRDRPGGVGGAVDKHQALADHFLFRHLSAPELDAVLARARLERRARNSVIFRQGDPGHGLVAVLRGQVKITAPSASGKEIVLNIIHPGEVFGEIALLDGKPRSADAVAITACELLVIDRRDFVPFLESRPALCIRLLGVLCDRLRRTSEQVQDLLFLDVRLRLAKALLGLAASQRDGGSPARDISLDVSQRELGSLVGSSRESINKQLREYQTAGVLSVRGRKLVICDLPALRRLAEQQD